MIEFLLLAGVGLFLAWEAFANTHTVNGTRRFTQHGREHVLKILQTVSLAPASSVVPGAITMQVVQPAMGITGDSVVSSAEGAGGIVLASDSILDVHAGGSAGAQAFVVTTVDPAVANSLAHEGSQFAILTPQ